MAVLTDTGSLSWATPASGESNRVIEVSLDADLPTGVNSLTIGARYHTTAYATAAGEITLTTEGQALINAIEAYNSGSTTLTYTFDVDAGGFTSKANIVVNFTMTSPVVSRQIPSRAAEPRGSAALFVPVSKRPRCD